MLKFPDGFSWGAATAAHQVEGRNDNSDWWDWEQTPGHIRQGGSSEVACDWWKGERYREDFDLARTLHQNAHRLSVEWSRIEPREGEWNGEAITFYRRVLTALRERGMRPLVTLHHFSNPRWLMQKGAWETPAVVPLFERYSARVVQELGDLCDFWVTINEPSVYALLGYNDATWPPGKSDFKLVFRVLSNMVRGHAAAYHALHRLQPQAQVGIAHHFRRFSPANPDSRLDRWSARLRDRMNNRLPFLPLLDGKLRFPMSGTISDAVGTQDFIGVNYYFTERCAFALNRPLQLFTRQVASDWPAEAPAFAADIDAGGLYEFTREMSVYRKPIYVTENGLFDLGGDRQTRYLVSHLAEVHRALREGAPVKGYFHWTLTDNFEWGEGWTARFGLFHLDPSTQVRTPRLSARVYGRIAAENGIADDVLAAYAPELRISNGNPKSEI